ncbi:MAG: hypothetical protein LBI29_03495 [Rickettsiales bacterium]|nr:hypothetical protein [Rickettsiales bacterium]
MEVDTRVVETQLYGRTMRIITDGKIIATYRGTIDEDNNPSGQGELTVLEESSYLGLLPGVYSGRFGKNFIIRDGEINIEYSNGSRYEGKYVDRAYNGRGKLTFEDGTVYEGNFKKGSCSGWGQLKFKDGGFEYGNFEDGELKNGTAKAIDLGDTEREYTYANGARTCRKIIYSNCPTAVSCEGEFTLDGKMKKVLFIYQDNTNKKTKNYSYRIFGDSGNILLEQKLPGEPKRDNDGKLLFEDLKMPLANAENLEPEMTEEADGKTWTIHYKNGDVYKGSVKDGKPNGEGRLVHTNGNYEEGTFADGEFTGNGKMKIINSGGIIYEGDVKNGKYDGKGIWENGITGEYKIGEFKEGEFETGNGKINNKDDSIYKGKFRDATFDGKGIMKYNNGDLYEGMFVAGFYSGRGKLTLRDNSFCHGTFENGLFRNGTIREIGSDGALREYDCVNGNRAECCKKITYKNGNSCEGAFTPGDKMREVIFENKNNKPAEYSHLVFDEAENMLMGSKLPFGKSQAAKTLESINSRYDFVRHSISGYGNTEERTLHKDISSMDEKIESKKVKIIYPGGITYEGYVKNGKYDGEGVLRCIDGKYYKIGTFKDGSFVEGRVKVSYPDGISYEGNVKNGKYDGQGKWENGCIYDNSKTYEYKEGTFVDGEFETGKVRTVDRDGNIYEGEFEGGLRHGYGKLIYAKMNIAEEGKFAYGRCRKIFITKAVSNLNAYGVYDEFGNIALRQFLSKRPQKKEVLLRVEEQDVTALKPLCSVEWKYSDNGSLESEVARYCSYNSSGTLEKIIEINYNGINEALSKGKIETLDDLVKNGLIVDLTEGSPKVFESFEEARSNLRKTLEQNFRLREGEGKHGLDGGYYDEQNLMVLTNLGIGPEGAKELQRARFYTGKISHDSLTSFLESIGIDSENLQQTTEKYFAMATTTSTENHSVSLVVNLEKIREIGWDNLNGTDETLIYYYDSGRIVGSLEEGGDVGAITKYCRALNWSQQELGSCWINAVAAELVALKNPDEIGKVFSGEIISYGHLCGTIGAEGEIPNNIMLKQMEIIQEIAEKFGASLFSSESRKQHQDVQNSPSKFLFQLIVRDKIIDKIIELSKKEKLLEALEKRIVEVAATRKSFSELSKTQKQDVVTDIKKDFMGKIDSIDEDADRQFVRRDINKENSATDNTDIERGVKCMVAWKKLKQFNDTVYGLPKILDEKERIR